MTLALYEYTGGVVDLASPVRTTKFGALDLVDFLYRSHAAVASIRLSPDQRWASVTYRRIQWDRTRYVWERTYMLREVAG